MSEDSKKVDIHSTTSKKKGLAGFCESFLRRFKVLGFLIFLIPVVTVCISIIVLSLVPLVVVTKYLNELTLDMNWFVNSFAIAFGLGIGFLLYGLTIIFVVPFVNFLIPFKPKAWRGNWHSNQTIPWYVHNALLYIVRYTFLDFITPTPLNILFYRMMGMKIGKGVVINTTNISDPCLIEIGDYATIGGSAHIMAHYGQKGYLILAPVKIGKGANIGLKASIMGDVEIGESATVKPHSVVLPKTRIADNELF